jgi:hypothetical protein
MTPPRASGPAAAAPSTTPTSVAVSSPGRFSSDNKYWVMIVPSVRANRDRAYEQNSFEFYNLKTNKKTIGPPPEFLAQKQKLFATVYDNAPFRFAWDDGTQEVILFNTVTGKRMKEIPYGVRIMEQDERILSEWAPDFVDRFLKKNKRFIHHAFVNTYRIQDRESNDIYRKNGDVIWQVPFSSCYNDPKEKDPVDNQKMPFKVQDSHIHLWGNLQASSDKNIGVEFSVYFKEPRAFALKLQSVPTDTGENSLYLLLDKASERSALQIKKDDYTVLLDKDQVDSDAGNVYLATAIYDLLQRLKSEPTITFDPDRLIGSKNNLGFGLATTFQELRRDFRAFIDSVDDVPDHKRVVIGGRRKKTKKRDNRSRRTRQRILSRLSK